MIGLTAILIMALVGAPYQTQAQKTADLQIMSLKGQFVGPAGKLLVEFDYLKPVTIYRLLPDTEAELATLDGAQKYKVKGPGVLQIHIDGRVTLNGKQLGAKIMTSELAKVQVQKSGGPAAQAKLGSFVMRGQGVTVEAKQNDGSTKMLPLYKDYYALVIGCGDYRSGWPSLPNPVPDAKEVAEALKQSGWRVDLLLDPNWAGLRTALNRLITGEGRKKEQAILLWYSGHGHTLTEADGSRLGYIVPVDAPDPQTHELGFMEKSISMRQIETVARRVMAKHMLMVFDSCFSGALFTTTRARPSPFIEEKIARPVRQFITAGNENEQVPDKSVFKTVFLQGIKEGDADRNKDSYVTGQELGAYLQEKVVNYTKKAQHPQYGKINNPKLDKGDFIFSLKWNQAGDAQPLQAGQPAAPVQPAARMVQNPAPAVQAPASSVASSQPPRQLASLPPQTPAYSGKVVQLSITPDMNPTDSAREFIVAWDEAWNKRDYDLIQSMVAPDAKLDVDQWGNIQNIGMPYYLDYVKKELPKLKGMDFIRRIQDFAEIRAQIGAAKVWTFATVKRPHKQKDLHVREIFELAQRGKRWQITSYSFEPCLMTPSPNIDSTAFLVTSSSSPCSG